MNAPAGDSTRAVFRIVIDGRIESIWRELTKMGEPQAAVFNAWLHAQALAPGRAIQMRTGTGKHVMVIGAVVEFDPPHRFSHTFRFTQYDDPECLVTYDLKQLPQGVECTLTVDRMTVGTRTAKDMQRGGTSILNTLKAVVETGRAPLGTRLMYGAFGILEFVLPARTKAEHWPLQ
jgi:uncharacterized protein YndB with AHSA1/START domain